MRLLAAFPMHFNLNVLQPSSLVHGNMFPVSKQMSTHSTLSWAIKLKTYCSIEILHLFSRCEIPLKQKQKNEPLASGCTRFALAWTQRPPTPLINTKSVDFGWCRFYSQPNHPFPVDLKYDHFFPQLRKTETLFDAISRKMVHGEINTSMQRHRRIIKKSLRKKLLNYIVIFQLHSVFTITNWNKSGEIINYVWVPPT